jgi:transcriptional regulator with XRE-family HTH domain
MDQHQPQFGVLLRRWRERRRMTQMDLAAAANSSTRHLSCLETARARPSREMVLRLAEYLEVPLRECNALLLAAGFAPEFQERSVAELTPVHRAIERVLHAHRPYPGFAVDRHWNVVLSNSALPEMYVGCAPELLSRPINAVRLMLHPNGLAPRIVNFVEWRAHVMTVLRQQLDARADSGTRALLAEVISYPVPAEAAGSVGHQESDRFATPLRIATHHGTLSFLNTTTVFGTPSDVTLSELALELLFPADDETIGIARRMNDHDGHAERSAEVVAHLS